MSQQPVRPVMSDRIKVFLDNPWTRLMMLAVTLILACVSLVGFFVPATSSLRLPTLIRAVAGVAALFLLALTVTGMVLWRQTRANRLALERAQVQAAIEGNQKMVAQLQEFIEGNQKAAAQLQAAIEGNQKTAAQVDELPKKIADLLSERLPADESTRWALVHETMVKRQGWGYASLLATAEIQPDGDALFERNALIEAATALTVLEQTLSTDPAKSGDAEKPNVSGKSETEGVSVEVREPYVADGGWLTEVEFDPPLGEGKGARFSLFEQMPKRYFAVGWDQQQLADAKITDQYWGMRIDRPTRELVVRVRLHVGVKVTGLRVEVRLAMPIRGSKRVRRDPYEESRVSGLLQVGPLRGREQDIELRVPWPIIGRIYMIRWDPLQGLRSNYQS